MNRLSLIVLAMGIALVVFALQPASRRSPTPPPLPAALRDEPDTYMSEPRIDQFDDGGRLQYRLRARTAAHYPALETPPRPETTRFESPRIQLEDADGMPWTLRADRGHTLTDPDAADAASEALLIRLERAVVGVRVGPADRFMRIQSETLLLDPDRRIVSSGEPVIIDTNAGRSTAGAFDGALSDGALDLRSGNGRRVHTLILPGIPQ